MYLIFIGTWSAFSEETNINNNNIFYGDGRDLKGLHSNALLWRQPSQAPRQELMFSGSAGRFVNETHKQTQTAAGKARLFLRREHFQHSNLLKYILDT